jgi:hypothetical protein
LDASNGGVGAEMIYFRIQRDGMPVAVTVGGSILVARSAEDADRLKIPPSWERVPFSTITVESWLAGGGVPRER